MSFVIRHTSGATESNPPLDALDSLLAEVNGRDPEHPDVSVSHESGWTISVFTRGRVIWENVEEDRDVGARHLDGMAISEIKSLLAALAQGRVHEVESYPWIPGYQ